MPIDVKMIKHHGSTYEEAVLDSRPSLTALELASLVVKQWDRYDKFRATEDDKALWHGDEPDDVTIARALVASNKAYGCELMDPSGTIWEQCAKYRDALIEIRDLRCTHATCAQIARKAVGDRH